MNLQPYGNNVLVELHEAEEEIGGIVIPDCAKVHTMQADIIKLGVGEIGKDGKRIPFPVKEGDTIILNFDNSTQLNISDGQYKIIPVDEILGIVEEETE